MEAYRQQESAEWERIRLISYTQYCSTVDSDKRVEIYDYLPLPSDPSAKERAKALTKEARKKENDYLKQVADLRKRGYNI